MSDLGLIVCAIIGLVGSIIVTQMWQNNWIKKESFKLKKKNILDENRIKMKKLERDLGVTNIKDTPEPPENKGILDLLKGLDKDKIENILDMLQGGEEGEEPGGLGGIIDHLPPELVKGFLNGINKKKDENQEETKPIYNY